MIGYGKQSTNEDDVRVVQEVILKGYLTTGPKVREFEEKFAAYVGAKYAVAVANGTAALHAACIALGISEGDEVIVPAMTFAASANCVRFCGGTVVFADITDEALIDPEHVKKLITPKTKAIIPVHYIGQSCNMEALRAIAQEHNLFIIEDACHALGTTYKDSKIGDCAFSNCVTFSFHPVKHITTGEGGMITTNDPELYRKLSMVRHHGITKDSQFLEEKNTEPWYHEMQFLGYNYRLSDINCALGINQLSKANELIRKRQNIAQKYDEAFAHVQGVDPVPNAKDSTNTYHLYVIRVESAEKRLSLFNYLVEQGIRCQVHYIPVYWHPYYKHLGYAKGLCPNTEDHYARILSIPIYPDLTEEQQNHVIQHITAWAEGTQ